MRNTPLLHKKAIDFWETTVSNSKHYLEYGMGGSTIRASELCQGSVTTVETNPKFYDKMLKHLIDANVDVYCMDWECGSLGYPKKELSDKEIRDYAFIPFEEGMKYDSVLVDGRFRMACLMAVFMKSGADIIMLDDSYRRAYKPLLEIMPPTRRLGNMAIWERQGKRDRILPIKASILWCDEFVRERK